MDNYNWDCEPDGELEYLHYHEELLQRREEEEATPTGAVRVEWPTLAEDELPF